MAFVKKKIWHSNEVAWSSPSSQPHRLRYGRAVEEMQKEHAAFSEFVMHHCASKSPVESGDPDISRVALDSRMGNRQGSPGTSSSGPEPALRLAKSSPHRPLSRYLSLDLSGTRPQPFGIGCPYISSSSGRFARFSETSWEHFSMCPSIQGVPSPRESMQNLFDESWERRSSLMQNPLVGRHAWTC